VKVWDARTGQEMLSPKGGSVYKSLVFSPDGQPLAVVYSEKIVTDVCVLLDRRIRTGPEDVKKGGR
jgi:hypothetical protein